MTLGDVLLALLIVVAAAVLGLVVHPLFWFVLVLLALILVRRGGHRHVP